MFAACLDISPTTNCRLVLRTQARRRKKQQTAQDLDFKNKKNTTKIDIDSFLIGEFHCFMLTVLLVPGSVY